MMTEEGMRMVQVLSTGNLGKHSGYSHPTTAQVPGSCVYIDFSTKSHNSGEDWVEVVVNLQK